jgi:DNA-binding transcriptional regulator YiaG
MIYSGKTMEAISMIPHDEFIPFIDKTRAEPPNSLSWLRNCFEAIQKDKRDYVFVICGPEQTGKTTLGLRTAWWLNKPQFYKDGKYDLSNVAFTGEEYRGAIERSVKEIVINDEAGTNLYARQAMTSDNIETNKALMVCGFKHLMHFLCLPSFFDIDSYVKMHRVRAIFKVSKNYHFNLWKDEDKIKKIAENKTWNVAPCSQGRWSMENTTPEFDGFIKAYKEKEAQQKNRQIKGKDKKGSISLFTKEQKMQIAIDLVKQGKMTKLDIADYLGITDTTLRSWERRINAD